MEGYNIHFTIYTLFFHSNYIFVFYSVFITRRSMSPELLEVTIDNS
jgi:hypothetical protein